MSANTNLVEEYTRILAKNGFQTEEIVDVRVDVPSLAGEHLGSDCFLVTLTFAGSKKTAHEKELWEQRHLFVKKVSANPPDFFKDVGLFDKESSFVNEMLPHFHAIHKEAAARGGASPPPLDFFPRYLHADETRIVMENLTKGGEGYSPVSKLEKLDIGYVKHVLDKLAQFHALSYEGAAGASAQEAHRDSYLARFPFLQERLYPEGKEIYNISYDNLIRTRISILKAAGVPGAGEAADFLRRGFGTVYGHVLGAISHKSPHVFYLVNHGDCWITNLLFKTDPVTKELLHQVFLDFQLMRIGSPCLDLCYFLFTSTRPALLHENWLQLLQFYFDRLKRAVELLGRPFVHFFDDLLADFKAKFQFGFWLNMTFFTGFGLFPHIDMQKVERDVEDTGLEGQVARWIQANPVRVQELAKEIVTLVQTWVDINMKL